MTVRTSEVPGVGLRLSFEPVAPDPTLEVLRIEEARALLTHLRASVSPEGRGKTRLCLVLASTEAGKDTPGSRTKSAPQAHNSTNC
jgi:hypothetical protein